MISPKDSQYTPISSASATASATTMSSTSSTEIIIQRHKAEVKELSENIHSFQKRGWIDEERATKYLRIIEHIAAGKKNPAEYGEKIFKMRKRLDKLRKEHTKKGKSDKTRRKDIDKGIPRNENVRKDDTNVNAETKKESRNKFRTQVSPLSATQKENRSIKKQGTRLQKENMKKSKSDNIPRHRDTEKENSRNDNVHKDDANVNANANENSKTEAKKENSNKRRPRVQQDISTETLVASSKKHRDGLRDEIVSKGKSDNKTRHRDISRTGDANVGCGKESRRNKKLQDRHDANSEVTEDVDSSRNKAGVIDNVNGLEAEKEKRNANMDLPQTTDAAADVQSSPTKEFAAMALHVQLKNGGTNDSTRKEEDNEGDSNGISHKKARGEGTGPIHQIENEIEKQEQDEQLHKNGSGKENSYPLKNVNLRGKTDKVDSMKNSVSHSGNKLDPPEEYSQPRSQNVQSKSDLDEKFHQGRYQGVTQLKDLHGIISHEEVQNIFVEMCTFARMGFVQPTTCLECAYSCSSCDENPTCGNLLVWRQNAGEEHSLQPKTLEGNILFVTCSTAQAWMRGDEAYGKKWDSKNKLLVDL